MPFFSLKFKSTANFSAPAKEGNLFFLSWRSAPKKIHNFTFKSSHLCQTSRHVWLSSSTCDLCCAYQLICIMTASIRRRSMERMLQAFLKELELREDHFYAMTSSKPSCSNRLDGKDNQERGMTANALFTK